MALFQVFVSIGYGEGVIVLEKNKKNSWSTPELVVYGAVEDLTLDHEGKGHGSSDLAHNLSNA